MLLPPFVLARALAGTRVGPAAVWAWCLVSLYAVHGSGGSSWEAVLGEWGAEWDALAGPVRWHLPYNLCTLRVISFAMDLHWARRRRPSRLLSDAKRRRRHEEGCGACQEGQPGGCIDVRTEQHPAQGAADFTLLAYLAYVLYMPLYTAGPTTTFNAFLYYQRTPAQGGVYARTLRGLARQLVVHGVLLELLLAFCMPFALSKTPHIVATLSMHELISLALVYLHCMFLKFTLIWRSMRLVALVDGVDAPENMMGCCFDENSISSFWRSWHRSFNRWLIRYVYGPIGGSGPAVLVVFLYVGFWHEPLDWRMVLWALGLGGVLVGPEKMVAAYWSRSGRPYPSAGLRAAAFVPGSVLMMGLQMMAFSRAEDGASRVENILTLPSVAAVVAYLIEMYSGLYAINTLRDWELRTGRHAKWGWRVLAPPAGAKAALD